MKRRDFFKTMLVRAGWAGGGALAGSAALIGYFQPRRGLYPQQTEQPGPAEKAGSSKRVVIVGGGLAGISSAMELSARGFSVTLLEASTSLGGKLTGWDIDALGEQFPVEHGFHGFFDQYYNLNELFAAAGVNQTIFDQSTGYPVLFKDFPEEVFGRASKYFPFNVLSIIQQSRRLDLMSFLRNGKGLLSTIEMFRYEYNTSFARYDCMDFMTYCRQGKTLPAFVDTVLHPFADATMNRMEVLSAAEALRYFHFYFMGSPEGLSFRITNRDCMTGLIEPLERELVRRGVKLRKGCRARKLVKSGERITAVVVDAGGTGEQLSLMVDEALIPSTGFTRLFSDTGKPVLVGRHQGGYVAFNGACTHMGCPVEVDAASGGFYCPCHSGRYSEAGVPVSGPPERPLARLAVRVEGPKLVVGEEPGSGEAEQLDCDYCIVASDVRGTRSLVAASELGVPAFDASVASLGEADPYVVYRLWIDRPLDTAAFPFYTVSGYRYTDSISLYSHFQEPFITWAKKHNGTVVELHAYAVAPEDVRPESEIRATMLEELHHMFPELKGATILHELYMQQSNFSRWAPGDHARRPEVVTPFSNLFLAGDWVRVDAPVFLMEAAAFTGRMAANGILSKESLPLIPLPVVAMEGLFA